MSGSADHCLALVRERDRDRYVSTLFAPDTARPHLLALYAFDLEVRRIPLAVSELQMGLIRLQWWRDTISALHAGQSSGHPVADALGVAISEGQLPQQALIDLIDAHEFDLYADQMPGLDELEAYLGQTCSRLILMAAMILDRQAAARAAEAAGLAGVAHGLATLLMSPERRDQFLPPGMDVTAAAAHAGKRLAEARARLADVDSTIFPAFLPASLTGLLLARVTAAPERPSPPSQFRRLVSMWWQARREQI